VPNYCCEASLGVGPVLIHGLVGLRAQSATSREPQAGVHRGLRRLRICEHASTHARRCSEWPWRARRGARGCSWRRSWRIASAANQSLATSIGVMVCQSENLHIAELIVPASASRVRRHRCL